MHAMLAEGSHGPQLIPPPTPAGFRPPTGHGAGSSSSGPGPSGSPAPRAAIGAASLQSFGKGDNENQDAFITSASSSGSKCFVGVFDGHGEQGKRMSNLARHTLARQLFNHKDLHNDPVTALESAYRNTQHLIEREHGQEAAQSGTTAVAAYQYRDRLVVANVGDSRAVLGRCDTGRRNIAAVELSRDHKPSRPDERERVLAAGGTVDQMAFPVLHNGGVRWIRGGPERVMDKNGMGGLAMSRSLGDLSLRPYVSSQPEVIERRLDSRDKVLVLGTDGVWDHVSSQEAVDIAGRHADPTAAAREITSIARRRWQAETDGMMSDDITAVVVKLEGPPGTSAALAPGMPAERAERGTYSPAQRQGLTRTAASGFGLEQRPMGMTASASDAVAGRRAGNNFGRSRSSTDMQSLVQGSGKHGGTSPLFGGKPHLRAPEVLPAAGRRSGAAR